MIVWAFTLADSADEDLLWHHLEELGSEMIWIEELEGQQVLYCAEPPSGMPDGAESLVEGIVSVTSQEGPDSVDWHEQWILHAPDSENGTVEIALGRWLPEGEQASIFLDPGPGFGDLSHVTTRMMIELLAERCEGCDVLDIGCGSGVLALVSKKLKAKSVQGIDIEEAAVKHAQENAERNDLSVRFGCDYPLSSVTPNLLLLNMITSEQEQAWRALPLEYKKPAQLISSGVLLEEREAYLGLWRNRGYHPTAEKEQEGWVAFVLEPLD